MLSTLAPEDPLRMLRVLRPYAMAVTDRVEVGQGVWESGKGVSPNTRLLALHALAETVRVLTSPQLLQQMSVLVPALLPSLSAEVVDVRKAVVFTLVEVYMVIGDALYPFVADLPGPQKKLLTIYIQRQLKKSQMKPGAK